MLSYRVVIDASMVVNALQTNRHEAAALAAGLVLGLAQQARGAHFMSHTLWSGWVCWCVAWAVDAAARQMPDYA